MSQRFVCRVNETISLTELREADVGRLVELLNNEQIHEWVLTLPFPYTENDALQFLEISRETHDGNGHPLHWVIRNDQEIVIGGFGVSDLSVGHRAEIGYWLDQSLWGQGIMTQVVRAGTAYAVSKWDLQRVTAGVFANNHASSRVLEKSGFEFEGVQRKRYRRGDLFIDARCYARVS